jgi:hypothetical protein
LATRSADDHDGPLVPARLAPGWLRLWVGRRLARFSFWDCHEFWQIDHRGSQRLGGTLAVVLQLGLREAVLARVLTRNRLFHGRGVLGERPLDALYPFERNGAAAVQRGANAIEQLIERRIGHDEPWERGP